MNKKSKFIISWILSLTLFTTMMFSVSAVQVQPDTEKIVSALQNIEQIKQDIGLMLDLLWALGVVILMRLFFLILWKKLV